MVTGRFGLPVPLIPHATPITIVAGKPIEVGPPNENPSPEQLNDLRGKYESELRRIFDTYKDIALPEDVARNGFRVNWRRPRDQNEQDTRPR